MKRAGKWEGMTVKRVSTGQIEVGRPKRGTERGRRVDEKRVRIINI